MMSHATYTCRLLNVFLAAFCLCMSAVNVYAEPVRVKDVLHDAAKYADRQIQIAGRVERWVELGDAEKTGLYVLKDSFGDEIQVKTTEAMPSVGENVNIKGVLAFHAQQNQYYLQAISNTGTGPKITAPPPAAAGPEKKADSAGFLAVFFTPDSSRSMLFIIGGVAAIICLVIFIAAIIVRNSKRNRYKAPDFTFEDTSTIRIDVNGKFSGSSPEQDETTQIIKPGYFTVTKGPEEMTGKQYQLIAMLTKVGREESGVNKSSGWIAFPATSKTISRHQFDLIYQGATCYIENRSQSAQTKINGVPLPLTGQTQLNDNDLLSFGEIEMVFRVHN